MRSSKHNATTGWPVHEDIPVVVVVRPANRTPPGMYALASLPSSLTYGEFFPDYIWNKPASAWISHSFTRKGRPPRMSVERASAPTGSSRNIYSRTVDLWKLLSWPRAPFMPDSLSGVVRDLTSQDTV